MKIFYSDKQVVDQGKQGFGFLKSPSALKPRQMAIALAEYQDAEFWPVEFVNPNPLSVEDFKLCHAADYVDGIFNLTIDNGFGNKSTDVNNSLFYTNGAMYDAALAATPEVPTCALVSGFHHAGYAKWKGFGYFCTLNGLMVTAMKFSAAGKKVAIIDCDMHHGNGTDDILDNLGRPADIYHLSFGKKYHDPKDAQAYLKDLEEGGFVEQELMKFKPDLIICQFGADVHVKDPFGGIFTTEEIAERDHRMLVIAHKLKIPLTWNLAGGYQIEKDGSINKVIEIHLNTFNAAFDVYGI